MDVDNDDSDSVHEPLIVSDHDHDHSSAPAEPPNQHHVLPALTLRTAGPAIRFLTLSAGISGLLFGFDTGVISSTLVSIGSDLSNRPLTTPDKSLVTAITALLALCGAPLTGYFADRYGRKCTIFVPACLFVGGAVTQALARFVWTMAAGRALVGVAVGVASGAVPLYVTELAPAELRGRLVTVQSLFITGGQVVAYLIGWIFASWPHGWRWMVGVGAVPAVVQLGLLLWMPETPRWLVQTGQEERARRVLRDVYAGLPHEERMQAVEGVLASIRAEISVEDKNHVSTDEANMRSRARDLLSEPVNRRALTIACLLQALQQLCGFNSLMYFSATIFSLVGFRSPIGTSLSIALTNFLFTLLAFTKIDTLGRRAILLHSIPWMILGLSLCSLSFAFIDIGAPSPASSGHGAWSIVLLASMILYVAAYAIGLGCVPWQQSELFPLRVRSLGSGLATATNWSSNFVVGMTFLSMMNSLGAGSTFALYAVVCLVGWVAIWRMYPETAGLELEGIGELLRNGWGVSESVESFRARRRERKRTQGW